MKTPIARTIVHCVSKRAKKLEVVKLTFRKTRCRRNSSLGGARTVRIERYTRCHYPYKNNKFRYGYDVEIIAQYVNYASGILNSVLISYEEFTV
jgi:hypothetical protein